MKRYFLNLFNNTLDTLVRLEFDLFRRSWSAFQVCGLIGLVLAVLLSMTLVMYLGLSPWVMAGLVVAAVLTFLGLVMATKIITGEEQIIYYHHQIAVMIMTTLLLGLLGQLILPYLDITILGVGLFLACGRVGCFMVGCCHGHPHRWGVCYREEHAAAGFTSHFVGVRLFPIQAVESLWVFGIVLVGSALVLNGHAPGEALAWYIVSYGIGRFFFEFMRGDLGRPYLWGFSEAQWTSLIFIFAVVGAELSGVLSLHSWHIDAMALIMAAMLVVALKRCFQRTAKYQLLHPNHVKEVAEAINSLSKLTTERRAITKQNSIPENIPISCTSLGIRISGGKIKDMAGDIEHYTFSSQNGSMGEGVARTLANLIIQLRRPSDWNELITGNRGVFHLLIHSQTVGSQK